MKDDGDNNDGNGDSDRNDGNRDHYIMIG